MSVHSLPHFHLPREIWPARDEVAGFLVVALILFTLFVWG